MTTPKMPWVKIFYHLCDTKRVEDEAHRGVDQLATTSCKDYGGHRFKPRFNRRPMVVGSMGLHEGHSGGKMRIPPRVTQAQYHPDYPSFLFKMHPWGVG